MAVLCIAGSGSCVGKTAVGCELIRAMPELRWLALKASPHRYGTPDGIVEERDAGSAKDTGRYLAAGAKRAFLLTGTGEGLEFARRARTLVKDYETVLVETGRFTADALAAAGEAYLTLAVLDNNVSNWKPGTLERACRADALVLPGQPDAHLLPEELRPTLAFPLAHGDWASAALIEFVRGRLRLERLAQG